jgi:hypothetical protein
VHVQDDCSLQNTGYTWVCSSEGLGCSLAACISDKTCGFFNFLIFLGGGEVVTSGYFHR